MKNNTLKKEGMKNKGIIATALTIATVTTGMYSVMNIDANNRINEKQSAIMQLNSNIEKLTEEREKLQANVKELNVNVLNLESENKTINNKLSQAEKEISTLENELETANNKLKKSLTNTVNYSNSTVVSDEYKNWKKIVVNASAYSTYDEGDILAGSSWGNLTASGETVRWGVIATDTSVIPMYSKVYIPMFNMVFIALDTGNAIVGNKIDIYFDNYSDCVEFGRRNIDIYVCEK